MPLPARDVLAAVIGVQKNLLKPEEIALAIAAGEPPGDHLGVKWDKLTDEAEDRLALLPAKDPNAPPPPPREKRGTPGKGSMIAAIVLGIGAVALLIGLSIVSISLVTANRARQELTEQLAVSKESDAEAREQGKLAREAVAEVFRMATEDPLFQQEQYHQGKKQMLQRLRPYHETFRDLKPGEARAKADQADSLLQLGVISSEQGKKAEGEELLKQSQKAYAALRKADKAATEYQNGEARAWAALGAQKTKTDEALTAFRLAREAYPADKPHPGLAAVEVKVADLQWQRRQREAAANYVSARKVYQALLAEGKDGRAREYKHHVAAIGVNLAVVSAAAGDRQVAVPEGLKNAEQALALHEELAKDAPAEGLHQHGRVAALLALGKLHLAAGRPTEAAGHLQQAKAIQTRLLADFPKVTLYQMDGAEIQQHLGHAQRAVGKTTEAQASYEQAIALYRKLDPELKTSTCQFGVARAERGIGLLQMGKDAEAARKRLLDAEPLLEALLKAHPRADDYRYEMAGLLEDSAALAAKQEEAQKAAVLRYERARDLWAELASEYDAEGEYWGGKARTSIQLAALLRQQKLGDARNCLSDAFDALKRWEKIEPGRPEYKGLLRDAHTVRADVRIQEGSFSEAASEIERAAEAELDPRKRLVLRNFRQRLLGKFEGDPRREKIENARVLTLLGVILMSEQTQPVLWRLWDAEPYLHKVAEADALFRSALGELRSIDAPEEVGLLKLVKTDPELAPLRQRDDFQGWLEGLEK